MAQNNGLLNNARSACENRSEEFLHVQVRFPALNRSPFTAMLLRIGLVLVQLFARGGNCFCRRVMYS